MLAAAGVGRSFEACADLVEGETRLSTARCLDFILAIPRRARIFAFAFNYDLTHILRDLPEASLYRLLRPELRAPLPDSDQPVWRRGPVPVRWGPYKLNMIGSKFVVQRGRTRRVVWDLFKFFQCRFTTALIRWGVASESDLETMASMKAKRAEFDKLSPDEIRAYCVDECEKMAILAEKLITTHKQIGLRLNVYHGPGSSATQAMRQMQIHKAKRDAPEAVQELAAHAFFGGRFEVSRAGLVKGPIYMHDISSAYPYQTTFLPCLECGEWSHTTDEQALRVATTAVVRYSLPRTGDRSWGPFPFRCEDGSITFPEASGGGWLWLNEYQAGKCLFPRTRFHEAWVYRTRCQHRPFTDVPSLYRERCRLGKDAAGLVLKLVINSIYGKLAQSVGSPLFQSWVWAGLVTAGTRAQLLDLMAKHKRLDSVVMLATDGLATTEKIRTPKPRDTGTDDTGKPLGGWETKTLDRGIFLARPGIYFPLNPTPEDLANVRARGIGRAEILSQWQRAVDAFNARAPSVIMGEVSRFIGAKSSVYRVGKSFKRSARYGQWEQKEIELSFHPMPKRAHLKRDGRLSLRSCAGMESHPYDRTKKPLDILLLQSAEAEASEQPDGFDYIDYPVGDDGIL